MRPASGQRCGITGRGHALPATLRRNDDPVFDWLNQHEPDNPSFYGYDQRHVLAPGEHLIDLMQAAALQALGQAGLAPGDVDLLTGFASVGDYLMPNDLAQLHQRLGLSRRCWVVPINNEYANFNAGLVFGDALIRAGQVRNALVVCGGNWSRHVDYHTWPAASAADGAGAAVLQRSDDERCFRVVDHEVLTESSTAAAAGASAGPPTDSPAPRVPAYGNMTMSTDRVNCTNHTNRIDSTDDSADPAPAERPSLADPGLFTQPYFHLTRQGQHEFSQFGVHGPVAVTRTLLERHALPASAVTILCHQTSRLLLDHWNEALRPHLLFDTLSTFANMTLASIPVNLSFGHDQIATDHLVLLGIGAELHSHALLLRRNG